MNAANRKPLLALAVLLLLGGMWAGLIRIGWQWPALRPQLPVNHGPLMIAGFLGTLISLERAVAMEKRWPYLAPLLSAGGGLWLLVGVGGIGGPLLLALGSGVLLVLFGRILPQHRALHTAVIALGALFWFGGNILWLFGLPLFRVIFWWLGFLVFTIAGERLELSRVLRLPRWAQSLFGVATAVLLGGILLTTSSYTAGVRIAGAGMLLLAAWLLWFDIARRNLRRPGLTGYIALCLFTGTIWLAAGGILGLLFNGTPAGLRYDAMLHAVFLGFVFAMIFGHAPLIFPAVLKLPLRYRPTFYAPLVTLHLSLLLRIAGDLFQIPGLRRWGGLLNALVILLFLAIVFQSIEGTAPHPG
jgi:hypothetical protein